MTGNVLPNTEQIQLRSLITDMSAAGFWVCCGNSCHEDLVRCGVFFSLINHVNLISHDDNHYYIIQEKSYVSYFGSKVNDCQVS